MADDFETEIIDGKKVLIKYHGSEQNIIIPDGIEIIGDDAFFMNSSLSSVHIPETVTTIGESAFYCCYNLTVLNLPEGIKVIGTQAFRGTLLTNIKIPRGVKEIRQMAFQDCSNLTSVVITENVDVLFQGIFSGCSSLVSVEILEGVQEIGYAEFAGCTSLREIHLPSSLTIIRERAFDGCSRLNSIMIPKGVIEIGEFAFRNCEGINIYYHHEPLEPKSIEGINNIPINLLDEENHRIGKLFIPYEMKNKPVELFASRLISGKIKHLSEYDALFSSIDAIVIWKVKIALCRLEYPLELLDEYKSGYIANLNKNSAFVIPYLIETGDVESISVFANVGAIPAKKIDNYINLTNKHSQTEILSLLLNYKNKIQDHASYSAYSLDFDNIDNDWETEENDDGTITIIKYLSKDPEVTIPSIINGKQVKNIAGKIGTLRISVFFPHKIPIENVIIEEGIEEIGERAFLECRNLKSVTLPGSINMIGKEAFAWCHCLTSVEIPESVKSIGEGTFENCFSLSSLHIPANVEKIGKNAFTSIGNLDEVLPDLVIHSPKESYAIEYAKENGIKYVET